MPVFTDQCGNKVISTKTPGKIISLVPSQTELLFHLGVGGNVTGITRYCVHPTQWKHEKLLVGGTKSFDFNMIKDINPDLIIGNKEENYREGIEELQRTYPVWMSDIYNLSDALSMITSVGRLVNAESRSQQLAEEIKARFASLNVIKPQTVLYLIWRKPWMAAGSQTFIDDMIAKIGLINRIRDKSRYPALSSEEISKISPDLIFLSTEPFPFKDEHLREIKELCPDSKVLLVDGEMFSWYGSRLLKSPAYFNSLPLARI